MMWDKYLSLTQSFIMKKKKRKKLRKSIRNIQSRLYYHLSETEHALLDDLTDHLLTPKKLHKRSGKGIGNIFSILITWLINFVIRMF